MVLIGVFGLPPASDLDQRLESQSVGVPHRSAEMGREAEAINPDGVDVTWAPRAFLVEEHAACVYDSEKAALNDFLV